MQYIIYAINGVIFGLLLIFWRVCWKKYIRNLNENVWNTKGMLNIIPTKIITNNELLMN